MKESDFWREMKELNTDNALDLGELESQIESNEADERAEFCNGDLYESINIEGRKHG